MLESPRRLCSKCDGPAVRDLVPMAGFVAAVDVWHARGRDRVERWQQAAFQRLIAATMTARAQALEPDITLAWRITAALAEDAPGHDGWAAYALMAVTALNRLSEAVERLTPVQQEEARVLARERLTALEMALPSSQQLLPLPQSVDVQVLRERYKDLKRRLEYIVPQLDRLLFTLPGADT